MNTKTQKNSKKRPKPSYRITNWPVYNRALVERGSVTVWLEEEAIASWRAAAVVGAPGAPRVYSDAAIRTTLTFRVLFHLPLRATQGFLRSVLRLAGLDLPVPDFSTLSRRARSLDVPLRKRPKGHTDIVVDSTGVKVYGEGEWKVRQHGVSKRRTWKKIHIAIGEDGEIRATTVTGNDTHDADAVPDLLEQEDAALDGFFGDGAFDQRKVYDACADRSVARIVIPPRHGARIWNHGNGKGVRHARDENLRGVRRLGRRQWKVSVGYHLRSLVETTMFRMKTIFGDRVHAREESRQVTELTLRCAMLNRMFHLGMPASVLVG